MKRVLAALVLCAPLMAAAEGSSSDLFAKGDAGAGAGKAAVCSACHGPNGNGAINPEWPKLAGQGASYLYEQLAAFKSQQRKNPVMFGQVAALSDEDMRNLAAYFAAQKAVPGVASKDSVAIAEKLYRAGDATRGVPACLACHGPKGSGNPAAQFPHIGGQNAAYAANQLKSYRSKERAQGKAQMMTAVAEKLSDDEIQALASYISGLQ